MPHYDYMPDGGCGDSRCNNGWYYWNGSEYPCSVCEKIRKQKRDAAVLGAALALAAAKKREVK